MDQSILESKMRMLLVMENAKTSKIRLPIAYNHLVQAAIYNSISPELAKFLHNQGFLVGKRHFKLFTFSRLMGNYIIADGEICFNDRIVLYISSPIERFIKEIADNMLTKGFINLGGNILKITEMSFLRNPEITNKVKIKMLSPVTMYSTLLTPEGKKKTYYYSPFEKEFCKLIDANAKKKHKLLSKRVIKSSLKITPIRTREVIMTIKGTVVKGWMGSFVLEGAKSLIRTVYEVGLGCKNSMGLGMFEIVK